MSTGRIVAGIPNQAAIAVGGALEFLHYCLIAGLFVWVSIAEQSERPDVRHEGVAQGQLERGGVFLLRGGELAQVQQLVQPKRRIGNSLVIQDLAEWPSLNLQIG